MPSLVRLDIVRRWLQYAFFDWTRDMPRSKRFITWVAILTQAVCCLVRVVALSTLGFYGARE